MLWYALVMVAGVGVVMVVRMRGTVRLKVTQLRLG